jgi:hypothetical protein
MNINTYKAASFGSVLGILLAISGCEQPAEETQVSVTEAASAMTAELSDAEVENLVRRSYQYVALYNVVNKGAMDPTNPFVTDGWNQVKAQVALADHTMQAIARPNNDTLYASVMMDLRNEPVIVESPAIDSTYVSLEVSGYDHYVTVPVSTRQGDFSSPSRILFYTERTKGYSGEAIEGIDQVEKATGDFLVAVFRVMPHANEPERMQRNVDALQNIKVMTLSEYRQGDGEGATEAIEFPAYGATDFDVFENNLLEVMQFVFNHTTFDPADEKDQQVLAAYAPLGVVPGRVYDPANVIAIDGERFRAVAERIAAEELTRATDPEFLQANVLKFFQSKSEMTVDLQLLQSVLGPLGLPAVEAVYPAISSSDDQPMTAEHDYVIRMSADGIPPTEAFWSITLYDEANGFFIPNEHKKYSVGENAGMQLNADGGIDIYIAAERPDGVPMENWLPVNRGDYGLSVILRVYVADMERFQTWSPPQAEKIAAD